MVPSKSYIQSNSGAKIGTFSPASPEGAPSKPPKSTVRLAIRRSESELFNRHTNSCPFRLQTLNNSQSELLDVVPTYVLPNSEPDHSEIGDSPVVTSALSSSRMPNPMVRESEILDGRIHFSFFPNAELRIHSQFRIGNRVCPLRSQHFVAPSDSESTQKIGDPSTQRA